MSSPLFTWLRVFGKEVRSHKASPSLDSRLLGEKAECALERVVPVVVVTKGKTAVNPQRYPRCKSCRL